MLLLVPRHPLQLLHQLMNVTMTTIVDEAVHGLDQDLIVATLTMVETAVAVNAEVNVNVTVNANEHQNKKSITSLPQT
jgi:hypothetical protein